MVINWRDRVETNPDVRSGQPTIRGMRLTVKDVLGFMAAGMTDEEMPTYGRTAGTSSSMERGCPTRVWEEARGNDCVIITKDSDFSDDRRYPGPPPQAVRLLLGNSTPAELEAYLREHAAAIEAFVASGERYREI